jgi:hypothetical protein
MRELQKNAISISTATLAPPPEKESSDPLIKLSGSFKPAGAREPSPQVRMWYAPQRKWRMILLERMTTVVLGR